MKYLCLVYLEEKTMSALPRSERLAISEEAMAYCDKLQKAGQLLAASPLQPVDGQEFMALNGGPHFKFTEAISFFVDCQTQEEVDELWENSLAEVNQAAAVGLKTSSEYRGKSFLLFWARC